MSIEQMLDETGAVQAIAHELGVDQATAAAGAQALLPQILAGFQTPAAASPALAGMGGVGAGAAGLGGLGGLGSLIGMLGGMGGGGLLDAVTAPQPTPVNQGNDILGQIFGSKDKSRDIAAEAAQKSGVEPSLLKKMLPLLAMVVGGYLLKKATAPAPAPANANADAPASAPVTAPTGGGAAIPGTPLTPRTGGLLGELIEAASRTLQRR